MNRVTWHLLAVTGALAAAALLLGVPPIASAQTDETDHPTVATHATYVGADACAQCHEEQAAKWEHNPHHGAVVEGHEAGKVVTCETCHGRGSMQAAADSHEQKTAR